MSLAGRWPADLIGQPAPDPGDLEPVPDAMGTEPAPVLRRPGAGCRCLDRRVGASPLTMASHSAALRGRSEPDVTAFSPAGMSIDIDATGIDQLDCLCLMGNCSCAVCGKSEELADSVIQVARIRPLKNN